MGLIDELNMDDLDGEQLEIAEVIGIDNYIKLVKTFGGNQIRIYQAETLLREKRDAQICSEYNGRNLVELTQKYKLSDRSIRDIVSNMKNIKGQISIFDAKQNGSSAKTSCMEQRA